MHTLTVSFGPNNGVWAFGFKTKEKAEEAWKKLATSEPTIEDDFGQTASFQKLQVNGVLLEDLEASKLFHIEVSLHRARTQAQGQQLASSDPKLLPAAMMNGGGPSMLTPNMGRG